MRFLRSIAAFGLVFALAGVAWADSPPLVTSVPYASASNWLRGQASATGTGATTLIAAQGAGIKIYVTRIACGNTAATGTTLTITLNDTVSTVFVMPTGGGNNQQFDVPLVLAANTALTFTQGTSSSTTYCNVQGYSGS